MEKPKELRPVLAKIVSVNSLGLSSWYEVVYYDEATDRWCSYYGSTTFEDGETVKAWRYVDEIELTNT